MSLLTRWLTARNILRLIALATLVASILWIRSVPGYEPLIGFLGALSVFIASFAASGESLLAQPQPAQEPQYPFTVVNSPDQLLDILLPDPGNRLIPDRSIQYIPGRVQGLDTLFARHGRILIRGRSKSGKTRELAELVRRRWYTGFTVLLLRDNAFLAPPYLPADQLPSRNILIIVNDVDKYCRYDQPLDQLQVPDHGPMPPRQLEAFPVRLHQAITFFERLTGSPSEVQVLATVRRELEFWRLIAFDPDDPHSPWDRFHLLEHPDLPQDLALQLIGQLATTTAIDFATPAAKETMAAKNDGTFTNIILQFRDWKSKGTTAIDNADIQEFQGNLTITWQKRYEAQVRVNPVNQYIYAAIDILLTLGWTPYTDIVAEIATSFEGTFRARLARKTRIRMHWLSNSLRGPQGFNYMVRQINRLVYRVSRLTVYRRTVRKLASESPGLHSWLQNTTLKAASFYSHVINRLNSILLYQVPRDGYDVTTASTSVRKAINTLIASEIPSREGVIVPYDGQVDGYGASWFNTPAASSLLSKQIPIEHHLVYTIQALVIRSIAQEQYHAARHQLDVLLILRPEDAYYYFNRGTLNFGLCDYVAASIDFSKAIDLQPDDGDNYFWRGLTYYEMKDYPAALADFTKAIELQPDDSYNYSWRARTYAALDNTTFALADLLCTEELLAAEGKPAYIAAAGYIQLDRPDDAIRLLRLAFQRSSELLDDIARDTDFDPIRRTPEFHPLLAEFGRNQPAAPGSEEP